MRFYAEDGKVAVSGRTIYRENVRYLGYSATAVKFSFVGKLAKAVFLSDPEHYLPEHHAWIAVYVNEEEEPSKRLELTAGRQELVLYEAEVTETVTITIMKYSEPEYAVCGIESIEIDSEQLLAPPVPAGRKIQIIGDSITCGYGAEGSLEDMLHNTATENPAKAYSVRTARALQAELEIVAWNGKGVITSYIGDEENTKDASWLVPMLYQYTDAGCSKQYFREEQKDWEKWDHTQFEPDLILIYLGTNDASYTREIPERNQEFAVAYKKFVEEVHGIHPAAKIICMLGGMDQRLCSSVEQAVGEVSGEYPELALSYLHLPLQKEEDGFGTFWHPTPVTHQKTAELVVQRAREVMNWDLE